MRSNEKHSFGYAAVEAALAKVFGANGKTLLVLRGRLKALQRAGLTPASPGRGKVIKYSISNIYDWGLALALVDFGLTPESIVSFVRKGYFAKHYAPRIEAMNNDSLFFCLFPYILKKVNEIPFPFVMMTGSDISAQEIDSHGGRVALINMTWLKRSLDAAIMEVVSD